jgi:hypothetical protein
MKPGKISTPKKNPDQTIFSKRRFIKYRIMIFECDAGLPLSPSSPAFF